MTVGLRRHASSSAQVPATFVSNVETGLRLAMVTMVWAARWITVSTSYSPSTRSRSAWSRTSPRTVATSLDQTAPHQLRLGHPVADETDEVGPELAEPPDQRAAHEARGPGDQGPAVAPEDGGPGHTQTRHGGLPPSHKACSSRRSRRVSMHCQKPSWR